MKEQDLMSREYDIRQIEEDPRLARCKREFLTLLGMIVLTVLVIVVICYVVDWGPVTGYTYLMGVPMWMALSAIVALIGTAVCLAYCVWGVKDVPLDGAAEQEKEAAQ